MCDRRLTHSVDGDGLMKKRHLLLRPDYFRDPRTPYRRHQLGALPIGEDTRDLLEAHPRRQGVTSESS